MADIVADLNSRRMSIRLHQTYYVLKKAGVPRTGRRKPIERRRMEIPDLSELRERYLQGETLRALAGEVGVAHTTLRARLAESGCPIAAPATGVGKIEVENLGEFAQRYADGESMKMLAGEAGVGYSVLRKRLTEAGYPTRRSPQVHASAAVPEPVETPGPELSPERMREVAQRFLDGETMKALGAEVGMHQNVLAQELKRAGFLPDMNLGRLRKMQRQEKG